MNQELQRYVNIVKEDVKTLDMVETIDLISPIVERLYDLTDDARRADKVIGWELDLKKKALSEATTDLNTLQAAKAKTEVELNTLRKAMLEEAAKSKEEIKQAHALLRKREIEINAKFEELEKQTYSLKKLQSVAA